MTYKGPLGSLIRMQDMLKCTQLRVMEAYEQIESSLGIITNVVPKHMERFSIQETLMLCLIELDERARLAQVGECDEYYTGKFIKNLLRGGTANEYINEATQAHTASMQVALQQYIAQGQKVTLAMTFETLCGAFIDINRGRFEGMHAIFNRLLSTS